MVIVCTIAAHGMVYYSSSWHGHCVYYSMVIVCTIAWSLCVLWSLCVAHGTCVRNLSMLVGLFVWTNHLPKFQTASVYFYYKLSQLYGLWLANFTTDNLWTVCTVAEVASGFKLHSGQRFSSSCLNWQRTVKNLVAIHVLCAMTIASIMCCLLTLAPWCWSIFLI